MAQPQQAWVEIPIHVVEKHWLSAKEKVLSAVFIKESQADNLLRRKGLITIDFLEKGENIGNFSGKKIKYIYKCGSVNKVFFLICCQLEPVV